jgi:hypothetical protein
MLSVKADSGGFQVTLMVRGGTTLIFVEKAFKT